MNPWTLRKVYFSIGNTTSMKKTRYHRNPWTLQNLSISLGNMKILKISRSNKKSDSPRMLIITIVFEEKRCWGSKTKIRDSKNAYIYCRFWWILMITSVGERWRTFSFWVWRGLQQDFEAHAMKDEIRQCIKWTFLGATARFWKVPNRESERHRRRVTKMNILTTRPNRSTLMS